MAQRPAANACYSRPPTVPSCGLLHIPPRLCLPCCSIAQRHGEAAVPGASEYARFVDDVAEIWRRTNKWSLQHTPYGLRFAKWSKVSCTVPAALDVPAVRCPHAAAQASAVGHRRCRGRRAQSEGQTQPPVSAMLQWGNLRYAANAAFTMLLRAQTLPPDSRVRAHFALATGGRRLCLAALLLVPLRFYCCRTTEQRCAEQAYPCTMGLPHVLGMTCRRICGCRTAWR